MQNRVVITGLGVLAPNGIGKEKYWKALVSGQSGIKKVKRFDTQDCPTNIGGEIDDFRPEDYIDKKAANHLSRFAQFALTAARMALDDSKVNLLNNDPYRIGIALGTTLGGKEVDEKQQDIFHRRGWKRVHPFSASLISSNFAVGVLAHEIGARGPNTTFSTGCTSALFAIGYAYDTIKNGGADVFVAGGTEAPLVPFVFNAFCASGSLASRNDKPEYASRPFDRNRNGYVLSEGCGIVILESLEHALKRKAEIYAEVKGYGVTNDAYSLVKMEPTGNTAAKTINIALKNSKMAPGEIQYVNAHGSSSQVSDKRETSALKQVFGDYAYKLPISSIKSMIGQALGAAGGMQVVASVLAMKNDQIPPTINYEDNDPDCDLDYTPNKTSPRKIDSTLINSFGLGGNNVSMILKKYHAQKNPLFRALHLF